MSTNPLPPKKVADLNARELHIFKQWIGHEPGGGLVPYPTPEERHTRRRRERWKQRYAGKGNPEPSLLIKAEQLKRLGQNVKVHPAAKKWQEHVFKEADEVAGLDQTFWSSFISELGPWNCRGNYCPHCIGNKSGEGLNLYFWDWNWRNPDSLRCPHCGFSFPDARYPEEGELVLPRLNQRYTFYVRPDETTTTDWRRGEKAARYVGEPVHVSFAGNLRAMKLAWALGKATPLSLAYAISRKKKYARTLQHILLRMAEVYPGFPLHSYLQDSVDADPGYAVEHADALPTVFKRNACFSAYTGRADAFFHGETTTVKTKVASGLWGASRLAPEMAATADTFVSLFQAYDLVKTALPRPARVRIEQEFLLELYLDVKAYTPITNKAGPVRAARVAFGLVYGDERELKAGLAGFHAILAGQFYPDGSMKEAPVYGHKPIGEGLWRIPEMLRGHTDLYAQGLYRRALQTLVELATPAGLWPALDDSYACSRLPQRTVDIARLRCGIPIPGPTGTPSDFAITNEDLADKTKRTKPRVLNKYYADRRLACLGIGAGPDRIQLYLSGADGLTGHRHHDVMNVQLFAGHWDVFPDLGYLWDHPGKKWAAATPSHQTVTVDELNSSAAKPSELLAFVDKGNARHVDMMTTLANGTVLRRAVTLIRKPDGLPMLIDVFEVNGAGTHDYTMRANMPSGQSTVPGIRKEDPVFFSPVGSQDFYVPPRHPAKPAKFALDRRLQPRRQFLYQGHSHYPLRHFMTGGKTPGGWQATWSRHPRRVTAHVLSDCDELITYQSPAWRSQ
ncbi:MAG: heparinase II/III-family protein, partial [Cephaloticoccus sp.]|nr:heparinase II/III-family protein [Cephaloticoccus sp.]